ncbi:hypothetical protein Csac_0504 [Caldicellulosiruptor saccharolyticus DSM 8903]|uniref:PIN domain-containing protein n=2 Tax=Caldicellulosiruptoraceae TaxID=3071002 RepID=A4XGV6_CALS8|nr:MULTISPECIES: type II toxin-antitoxin system VapC family toxin [Caldicellulosiruptor]ABP66141.1 hypothetical protein Csac_0504 [Caldicellulosiruptor saccharolyticus DSM 8903]
MRRLRVYLDTSVISHLDHHDNPEYMQITRKFWEELKQGKYNIYISSAVITELNKCKEPKRSRLLEYMSQIEFTRIEINQQVLELAQKYVNECIIPSRFFDDAVHIAVASINECDILVSWNFKHIVRYRTIQGVNAINKLMGYREIQLVSPLMMLEEEE